MEKHIKSVHWLYILHLISIKLFLSIILHLKGLQINKDVILNENFVNDQWSYKNQSPINRKDINIFLIPPKKLIVRIIMY